MTYQTYEEASRYYASLDQEQIKSTVLSTDAYTLTWRIEYYSGTFEVFTSPLH